MKKYTVFVFVLAAIVSGLCSSASAADAGQEEQWAGPYIGFNGGFAWGKQDLNDLTGEYGIRWNTNGWLVGGQLGYNWQAGAWVLGVETDLQSTTMDGNPGIPGADVESRLDWFGTTRFRGGYSWNDSLLYGTAGLAYGRNRISLSDNDPVDPLNPVSDRNTHLGWVAGVGVEHAFTNHISAKMEYLYTDLGKKDYFQFSPDPDDRFSAKARFHTVRAGINFRF